MIICHCNRLTRDDLAKSIDRLLAFDPTVRPVPSVVHAEAGCRSKCCGCYPELQRMIDHRMETVSTEPIKPAVPLTLAFASPV